MVVATLFEGVDDTDGARAIFERAGGIAAFVFHEQLADAEFAGEAGEVEDRRPADGPALREGRRVEGQEFAVAPLVLRAAGEWFGSPGVADAVEVEADFEDAVGAAGGAGHFTAGRGERLLAEDADDFTDAVGHGVLHSIRCSLYLRRWNAATAKGIKRKWSAGRSFAPRRKGAKFAKAGGGGEGIIDSAAGWKVQVWLQANVIVGSCDG